MLKYVYCRLLAVNIQPVVKLHRLKHIALYTQISDFERTNMIGMRQDGLCKILVHTCRSAETLSFCGRDEHNRTE